jgi:hypothetical protein
MMLILGMSLINKIISGIIIAVGFGGCAVGVGVMIKKHFAEKKESKKRNESEAKAKAKSKKA